MRNYNIYFDRENYQIYFRRENCANSKTFVEDYQQIEPQDDIIPTLTSSYITNMILLLVFLTVLLLLEKIRRAAKR